MTRRLIVIGTLLTALHALAGASQPLRICSDPANLPFSNAQEQGFENRIALLLAGDLNQTIQYTWRPQRRGFLRETLDAGRCDVVMGLPTGIGGVETTRPYYRSSYVFVSRRSHGSAIRSFDDDALRRVRVGVQIIGDDGANSPPAHVLSRRHIVNNIVGYSIYPPARPDAGRPTIVEAVARGDVDVAIVWGPFAGFFASRARVPLEVVPVSPRVDAGLPLTFAISMAVRRGDLARRDRLDGFLRRHRVQIERILDEFHVPRLPHEPRS